MSGNDREATYARLRTDLESAVRRVCPSWLADRAPDLVQAGILKLLERERRQQGEEEGSEGNHTWSTSYLYRVAHSVLVDEIRARRRKPEVALEDDTRENPTSSPAATVAAPGASPEDRARSAQIGRAMRECLADLIEDRRRAVSLHLAGHSVPEAAGLLGWAAKRTENLVYRGIADLRRCLEQKGQRP